MPKYFSWKKIMTGALAFTIITGSAVPVLTSNPTIAEAATTGITPFVDVPAGLYAEKHIYRLSLQNIVKGYVNKTTGVYTFQYNNTISQQEAVIMAIRFAGLDSKRNTTDMIFFDEKFIVKEDYKSYIELAFQEGILDRELEYKLAAADTTTQWGVKAASREWVTKLIIKAIGAESKAKELANTATAFTDNSKIDSSYLGYVNAAVDLGLIKGLTATTFGPTAPINRASFATILSRAQKDYPIEVEGQHYGILTGITDKSITVYENNKETTYNTDATTGYYETDSDYAIDRSNLIQYGKVAVLVVDGVAKFIESQGKDKYVESFTAPIGRVNTADKVIYIWVDNKPVAISYNDDVKFLNAAGETITVATLKENDTVTILRDTFRENATPISITLTGSESKSTTISGTFYNSDSKSITVKTDNGLVSKFLSEKVAVSIPFVTNATLADLISNADVVTITMNEKDEVTRLVVSERNMKTMYAPTIINFDASKKLITVLNSEGNTAEALFLQDGTRYMMDGVLVEYKHIQSIIDSWENIVIRYADQNGKKVVVYYDLVSEYEGELVELNDTDKLVTFKLPDGTKIKMDYTDAGIESLTDTKTNFLNMKVGTKLTFELSSSESKVISFNLHETQQLTVQAITQLTKEVKFKDSKNNTYSVLFEEASFEFADGSAATIKDLAVGKTVNVTFAGSSIKTVTIQ